MSLPLFERHRLVGIDSNVLIYLLEGTTELAERSAALLDAIAAGEGEGVLSVLALAEVCSGPARLGDLAMVERYADELTSLEGVRVVALGADTAVDAAVLRASGPITLADAIQLAAARAAGATAFVTNDRRIQSVNRLAVIYLDDLAKP